MSGPFWPAERIDALIAMWASGQFSMTEIGVALGITRNQVSGKIYRLRLARSPMQRRAAFAAGSRKGKRRKKKPKLKYQYGKVIKMPKKRYIEVPKEAPVGFEVTLLNRKPSQCSFIVGHQTCCGAKTLKTLDRNGSVVRSSWCAYHYNIVYGKDAA